MTIVPDVQQVLALNAYAVAELAGRLRGGPGIIPVIGAGMSAPLGFPTWPEFLRDAAVRVGGTIKMEELLSSQRYEEAADFVAEQLGEAAFHDLIDEIFGDTRLRRRVVGGAVSVVPKLAKGPVITLNFDHVLERVFEQVRRPFSSVVRGVEIDVYGEALEQGSHILMKLHGDADDRTRRVFRRSDYDREYSATSQGSPSPLVSQLERISSGGRLLFLGCSLVKDRFLDVLAAVVARQRSIVNFAVLERPASGDEFAARTRWLSMIGVRPLWFPKGRFDVIGPLLEHVVREARLVPTVSAEQRAEQETVRISAEIEAALDRKQALLDANVTTTSVEQEILALKRRLRETGQVRAGDSLSGGRYLLVRTLGSGGFATVWEAEDRHEKRRVAIKILHPMIATDQQRRERFLRGARTMQSLKHDSIVKVFDPDGQDGGILFLVMELAAGGDLRRFALEHPFEPSEALALIGQVGSALAFAHDAGLVHRDVKPANILLTGDRRPMLTDFDLVGGQHTTGGTRTGALGTFVYAAPELMSKPQDATAAADVYGLAATAVFLLSRADLPLLFVRDSSAVIKTLPCSPAVKAVLSHATAWEPAMRHADAREFCEDLRNPPAVLDPDARKSLRFVSGKYQGGECPLRQGSTVVIGRSSELDMVLVEDMVSRRHARITVSDQIVVEDLGSVNGTFVNGEKVKRASLQEGDRILIGTSIMKLVVWADEPDAVEEDDGFGSTRPRPLL